MYEKKVYIKAFFIIWSTHLPVLETNAFSVLSHWSLSWKIISKIIPGSLGRFHLVHIIVSGQSPPTEATVILPPANTKWLFPRTSPSSNQVKAQHLTKVHTPGFSFHGSKEKKHKAHLHLLNLVSYFFFAPGHLASIRLIILEGCVCHWTWQTNATWMKQGVSSRAQKAVWNKRSQRTENEGMWGTRGKHA